MRGKAEVDIKAGNAEPMSRNQKELQFLMTRQKEFKLAALQAKKDGNIDNAKDYLRKAKVIEANFVDSLVLDRFWVFQIYTRNFFNKHFLIFLVHVLIC